MATHSTIHAWGIPWIEETGMLQSRVAKSWKQLKRFSIHTHTHTHTHTYVNDIGKYSRYEVRKKRYKILLTV